MELKKIFKYAIILIFLFQGQALTGQVSEALVKAGFIEKFTHFIEWPGNQAEGNSSNQFIIKIIGETQLGSALDDLFSSSSLKNKNVKIEYISSVDEIKNCRILFISQSNSGILSDILEYTTGKPILTISDTEGFGEKGVLINLFKEDNYIRYEVNKAGIEKSGLEINSLLLSYAVIIDKNG